MYISLNAGRANGFKKWSEAHRRDNDDNRSGGGIGPVVIVPHSDYGVTTLPVPPYRPWLMPGVETASRSESLSGKFVRRIFGQEASMPE